MAWAVLFHPCQMRSLRSEGSKYLAPGNLVVNSRTPNTSQVIGLLSPHFPTHWLYPCMVLPNKCERTCEPSSLYPPLVNCHSSRELIHCLDWNKLLVSKENNKHLENHNLDICVCLYRTRSNSQRNGRITTSTRVV